jgi:hypothetical protein
MTTIAHDIRRDSAAPGRHTVGRVTVARTVSSELIKLACHAEATPRS